MAFTLTPRPRSRNALVAASMRRDRLRTASLRVGRSVGVSGMPEAYRSYRFVSVLRSQNKPQHILRFDEKEHTHGIPQPPAGTRPNPPRSRRRPARLRPRADDRDPGTGRDATRLRRLG